MASKDGVGDLLMKLTSSLESAISSVPDTSTILRNEDGISLLDVKSELFLTYVHNLGFLILLKLRKLKQDYGNSNDVLLDESRDVEGDISEDVLQKLVELRVYLEKGVRPLESRLKYQIDKVLKAADTVTTAEKNGHAKNPSRAKHLTDANADDGSESNDADSSAEIDDMSYKPNPSAFFRSKQLSSEKQNKSSRSDGVYRPPRITPTALPTTTPRAARTAARKPRKSAAMDEYISTELSSVPTAEPSIGSTIIAGGRRTQSQKERAEDAERQQYEEANYTRLPTMGRKEKAMKGYGGRQSAYGGEELTGLREGVDRIERLTLKSSSAGRSKRATEDGPRGSGFGDERQLPKKRKTSSRR